MKTTTLLSLFLITILLSACNSKHNSPAKQAKADIPEPLEEPNSDVVSSNRGGSGNMVDAIYTDLVKRKPDLQKLEDQLGKFNESKTDSLAAFNIYKSKVESYYSSANRNLENIKDTVLKARLKVLLSAGKTKYNQKTSKFKDLITDINNESFVMNNYYETLKIVATLPVMENYQDNNIPDIKAVKSLDNEAKGLKAKTVKLVKAYDKHN
jgi:hypothetical protein